MRIRLSAASSWCIEKIIESDNVESVLNDLRNGKYVKDVVNYSSSDLLPGINPSIFIVTYCNCTDYDVEIEIYDDYIE